MTDAELFQPVPEHWDAAWNGRAGEPELELPASLYPWVAALAVWPCVDEPSLRLVAHCFGQGRAPEWTFLASLLERAGLVAEGPEADTYTFHDQWHPVLERGLDVLGGANDVRSKLIDAWLRAPDRLLVAPVVRWASDLARWDAMDAIWRILGEQPGGPPPEALAVYRDLPLEARKARPMLTYASGAAESLLASEPRQKGAATLQRLMLDSALVHSDWATRADTDAAVGAGTIRMIGERRMPTTRPGQALQAAWRTKQEIDDLIDTRSRVGRGPGRTVHAVFRVFSARLALFLGDPQRALSEAHWAALLSDWEPASALAFGIEALARSVSSDDGPTDPSERRPEAVDDAAFVVPGFKGMGQVFQILADGHEALRRLDRDELDRSLSAVSSADAAIAGLWSVRSALDAIREALWGDPSAGANRLAAEISRQSVLGREHEEPFGSALLTRARVLLLTKTGAFGAASQVAGSLTGSLKVLPTARIHLWTGQFARAIQTADSAAYEDELDIVDRSRLTLLRAAAALLAGTCAPEVRASAVSELRRMVPLETFLPIALMPRPARDVLVELYQSDIGPGDSSLHLLIARLAELNDADRSGVGPVRLTEREVILLPLLAGDDPAAELARKLHVSVNTVRKQVVTLREKFAAESRAELIKKAYAYGVLRRP